MYRLFVGLALSDPLRDQLARLNHGLPKARWVDPDAYHITLRFIGEVDRHTAADIDGTLQRIEAAPFELTFSGMGTFGQGRKARSLWVRAENNPGLRHLQGKVESAAVRAGLDPEPRKFMPHVTLARFRDVHPSRIQAYIERHGLFRAGPEAIDRFVLFESHMGKGGSVYEELADYPLHHPQQQSSGTAQHAAMPSP
jgi:2'-5' RNA ligase